MTVSPSLTHTSILSFVLCALGSLFLQRPVWFDIPYHRAYALVLSGNHVYTSGAGGTNAAAIRGALRAERDDLLTVVLPQSMGKQTKESQELLKKVKDVITMPQNDDMTLDVASRICNSYLLSQTDQLISFAFHESSTVIEAATEAKELDMLVTTLFLD